MNIELMKRCLAALEESRDDVERCLYNEMSHSWVDERVVEHYRKQLDEHEAVITELKKELEK